MHRNMRDQRGKAPNLQGLVALGSSAMGVALMTPACILLAIFAGRWLDTQLGTKPLFVLGLVLASIPASLFILVRSALDTARTDAALLDKRRREAATQTNHDINREDV